VFLYEFLRWYCVTGVFIVGKEHYQPCVVVVCGSQ